MPVERCLLLPGSDECILTVRFRRLVQAMQVGA